MVPGSNIAVLLPPLVEALRARLQYPAGLSEEVVMLPDSIHSEIHFSASPRIYVFLLGQGLSSQQLWQLLFAAEKICLSLFSCQHRVGYGKACIFDKSSQCSGK